MVNVTLSLEGMSLRLVQFSKNGIEKWVSIPLDPRSLESGLIANSASVSQVLGQALAENGLSRAKAVAALPALGSASRILTLPRMGRAKFEALVNQEARRLMAVSLDTANLYWQDIPGGNGRRQIFVLAVPKTPLLTMAAVYRSAGLTLPVIELRPISLIRAVGQKEAIIAHGEINCIEIVVVSNYYPILIRSLFTGDVADAKESVEQRLGQEIEATLNFYDSTYKDFPISPTTPIYLTGEIGADPAQAENVAQTTGRPVAKLEPSLSYPPEFPLAQYMTNVGLILRKKK